MYHLVRIAVEYAIRVLQFEPTVNAEVCLYDSNNLLAVATVDLLTIEGFKTNFLNASLNASKRVHVNNSYANANVLDTVRVKVLNIYSNKSYDFKRYQNDLVIVDYISRVSAKPSAPSYDLFVQQIKFLSTAVKTEYTEQSDTVKMVDDNIPPSQTTSEGDTNQNKKDNDGRKPIISVMTKKKIDTKTSSVDSENKIKPSTLSVTMLGSDNNRTVHFIRYICNGVLVSPLTNINLFVLDYILFLINSMKSMNSYHTSKTDASEEAMSTYIDWVTLLIQRYFTDCDVTKKTNYLGGVSFEIVSKNEALLNKTLFYKSATIPFFKKDKLYEQSPDIQVETPQFIKLAGEVITAEEFLCRNFNVDATKIVSFWKGVFDSTFTFPFKFVYNWYEPYMKYALGILMLPCLSIGSLFNSRLKYVCKDVTPSNATPYDYWINIVLNVNYNANINSVPTLKVMDTDDFILSAGVTNFVYVPAVIEDINGVKELCCVAGRLTPTKTPFKIASYSDAEVYLEINNKSMIYSATNNSYPEYLKVMMSKRKIYFGMLDQRLSFDTAYKSQDWQRANSYIISIMSNILFGISTNSSGVLRDYREQPMCNNLFSDVINRKPAYKYDLKTVSQVEDNSTSASTAQQSLSESSSYEDEREDSSSKTYNDGTTSISEVKDTKDNTATNIEDVDEEYEERYGRFVEPPRFKSIDEHI